MKEHPKYSHILVTECGAIYSQISKKFLKVRTNTGGYLVVSITVDGKYKVERVHRLVAETYLSNTDNLPEVNHKDGIKTNNHVTNLEWVTSKQNKEHAWLLGLYREKGSLHYNAKLSEEQVVKICELLQEGKSSKVISDLLNIHKDHIAHIKRGDIWKDISKNYNIKTTSKSRKTKEIIVKICEYIAEGLSDCEISKLTKTEQTEVSRIRRKKTHVKISCHYF